MPQSHLGATTRQLLRLCGGYFVCYVGTGIAVKYFTELSSHPMSQLVFLFQNTAGSSLFAIALILLLGWHRLARPLVLSRKAWPIAFAGFCTAVVIPTTTLMYLLPISVMVAMVIMRGSVIMISRLVDAIQIRQGILKKKVSWEEDWAVFFALLAVAMNLLAPARGAGKPEFIHDPIAVAVLVIYLTAYSIRLYIMNYYKNTAREGERRPDNRAYFAVEQVWASAAMLGAAGGVLWLTAPGGPFQSLGIGWRQDVLHLHGWAMFSGIAYGGVAFFSVFIFMFPGRTATFAGVANRLTSLTAGTVSTLILALLFTKSYPTLYEWGSLFWIGIATGLLIRVETKQDPRPVPVLIEGITVLAAD